MKKTITIIGVLFISCLIAVLGLVIGMSNENVQAESISEKNVYMPQDICANEFEYTLGELDLNSSEKERFVNMYNATFNIANYNAICDIDENIWQEHYQNGKGQTTDYTYDEIKDIPLKLKFSMKLSGNSGVLKDVSQLSSDAKEIVYHDIHSTVNDGEIVLSYNAYIGEYYRICYKNIVPSEAMIKTVLNCTDYSDEVLGFFLFRYQCFYSSSRQEFFVPIMLKLGIFTLPEEDFDITILSFDKAKIPTQYKVVGYYKSAATIEREAAVNKIFDLSGKDYYTKEVFELTWCPIISEKSMTGYVNKI